MNRHSRPHLWLIIINLLRQPVESRIYTQRTDRDSSFPCCISYAHNLPMHCVLYALPTVFRPALNMRTSTARVCDYFWIPRSKWLSPWSCYCCLFCVWIVVTGSLTSRCRRSSIRSAAMKETALSHRATTTVRDRSTFRIGYSITRNFT